MGLLWGYYALFLRKGRQFRFNRFYLLAALPIGFGLPLLSFSNAQPETALLSYTLPEVVLERTAEAEASFSLNPNLIYWVIGLAVFLLLLVQLGGIIRMAVRGKKFRHVGHTEIQGNHKAPASFGPWLFWNPKWDQDPGSALIRAHEVAHIRQYHSVDLVIYRIAGAICWANPFIYLLQRELRRVHECLADEAASRSHQTGTVQLQRLILARQLGVDQLPLVNHFSSHTKHRIIMLNKSQSPFQRLAMALVLPLLAGLFTVASYTQVNAQNHTAPVPTEEVTEMPQYTNMAEFRKSVGYPKDAVAAGIEGKVIIKMLVGTDGSVESHEFLKGEEVFKKAIDKHIDELKFTPGIKDGKKVRTYVTLPMVFKL